MFASCSNSIRKLFSRRIGRILRKTNERNRRRECLVPEALEERRLMAFDLVSAYAASDTPFYVSGVGPAVPTLQESPQQITLRFSPGVKIDQTTLAGNILIQRSGGAGDGFGSAGSFADVTIKPGSLAVDDLPNQNQVVIRFADTLPDDSYQITIGGGLKTTSGDTFRNGSGFSLSMRVDLGAYVMSVVPQPVSRSGSGLGQNRDQIGRAHV